MSGGYCPSCNGYIGSGAHFCPGPPKVDTYGGVMEHDPMCPMPTSKFMAEKCRCDLIARVAERERERAAARVAALERESEVQLWSDIIAAARGGEA